MEKNPRRKNSLRNTAERMTGKRIRAERLRLQMTQVQFARMLHISTSYLGSLERGYRPVSRHIMEILHQKLGLSYDYLLEGRGYFNTKHNVIRDPSVYQAKRDLSLMISSCTEQETKDCYNLIHTYLNHSRSAMPSADAAIPQEAPEKQAGGKAKKR